MLPMIYEHFAASEDEHWWFVSRRLLAREWLHEALGDERLCKGLDAGCGTGGNLRILEEFCEHVTGVDYSAQALSLARSRFPTANFERHDLNDIALVAPPASIDLITCFTVLYHRAVKDEANVLRQFHSLLKPGAYLLLNEPAFAFLFRDHDAQVHGKTRYTPKQLETLARNAGFEVMRVSCFNLAGFLPALAGAVGYRLRNFLVREPSQGMRPVSELSPMSPWARRLALAVMTLERGAIRLLRRLGLGVSVMLLARKSPAAAKLPQL